MQVSSHDIDSLLKLQQVDLDINRITKELESLPQRQIILNARTKRSSIEEKGAKIAALKKETGKKLTKINDEDASLAKKENGVQAAIEAAGHDFRGVEARTKELNGIFKRRQTIAEEKTAIEAEMSKIQALEDQVNAAIAECTATENDAIDSFKKEGGALTSQLTQLKTERENLIAGMDAEVAKVYRKTADLVGSVTLGKLVDGRCGVCRTVIEGGHLIDLKSNAPMGTCPACNRLLIIEE